MSYKQHVLVQLNSIQDINDPNVASVLMGLSIGGSCNITDAERQQLLRFLDSANTVTFGGASECLWQTEDRDIWARLISYGDMGDYSKEQRIAELLYRRGQEERYNKLAAELQNPQTPLEKRKVLARLSLEVIPQLMTPVYVELLSDPDPYIRYLVHRELRRVFGGQYAFKLDDENANAAIIDQWKIFLQANSSRLPRFRSPQSYLPVAQGIGIGVNVKLEEGALTIVEVIPGYAAQTARLVAGDVILAANGIPASRYHYMDFIRYEMLGKPNTFINLKIRKASSGQTVDMDIMRKMPK